MSTHMTRRRFLAAAGAAASVTFLGQSLFDFGTALAAPPLLRRDVGGLTATHPVIVSYRRATSAMRALPATDPRSWAYQAAIHGTLVSPAMTSWNSCEHSTYFFWSWHRMYLYWFERIIRKMSGDMSWALPYWNWSSKTGRQLPAVFRDTASELYTVNRRAAMNDGTGSLSPSQVNYSTAFSLVNFISASGSLEGVPHGAVHGGIGGWMGSVPTAGQDPIFYLHHCNIDRLWNLWLAQGGGRTNPLSDATWKTRIYTFFDENGRPVRMTSCDVLRAAQQLNYAYEGEPPQVNEYCLKIQVPRIRFARKLLIRLPIPPVVLTAQTVSFSINVKQLRQQLLAIAESKTETLFLELEDVEADRQPGVVWDVYVGLPANAAPNPESPYYVGGVSLFGTGIRSEMGHQFKPARMAFAIDRAIQDPLKTNAELIPVIFVPQGILIQGQPSRPEVQSPVRIGRASLVVEKELRQ